MNKWIPFKECCIDISFYPLTINKERIPLLEMAFNALCTWRLWLEDLLFILLSRGFFLNYQDTIVYVWFSVFLRSFLYFLKPPRIQCCCLKSKSIYAFKYNVRLIKNRSKNKLNWAQTCSLNVKCIIKVRSWKFLKTTLFT